MMRNPELRYLTSLEEDFKEIGILDEDTAPASDPDDGFAVNLGELDEEALEDDVAVVAWALSEDDLLEGEDIENLAEAVALVEKYLDSELEEDELDEGAIKRAVGAIKKVARKVKKAAKKAGRRIRKMFRGGKVIRTKKTSATDRRKARMYRRSGKGKAALRKRSRLQKKSSFKRRKKRQAARAVKRGTRAESMDYVTNVLEDVANIVRSLDESDSEQIENAIKAFANVAIISEMIADFFSENVELVEHEELSEELADAAMFFGEQAELAAFIASALDEGTELDEGIDLDILFQEQMSSLVEGLSFYADLTEGDDEDDDDDDDEDDDEDYEGK